MPHDLKDLVNIDIVQDVIRFTPLEETSHDGAGSRPTSKVSSLSWVPSPTEEILRQVSQAIAMDRDGKIRKALIDLGWTPPVEDAKS